MASYDEDTTSMGVEAGRAALAGTGVRPSNVLFATADPAYLDKTNAVAIHAALALDPDGHAYDMSGAVRSAAGVLQAALAASKPTLVVTSDIRGGLPSSADEVAGGDGASAVVVSDGPGVADYLGGASTTAEFLDRWRIPGERSSRVWEERFGETAYEPLGERAVAQALKDAGLQPDEVDVWAVTGSNRRAVRRLAVSVSSHRVSIVDDLAESAGNTGTAHPLMLLAAALEQATPGQTIGLAVLADGADVLLFRATEALAEYSPKATVARQAEAPGHNLAYTTYLTWRGMLDREPPRRPEPDRPAAPPAHRGRDWKFALVGGRCVACETRHLPPQRVCVRCGALDQMSPESLAGVQGRIATFTVDRLTYSLSPPVVVAVIDFDGGGRYTCELTDADATAVAIGDRVEMTFRRHYTVGDVHNYFWKARPIREGGS